VPDSQFQHCHSPLIEFSLPGIKHFSFDNEEMAIGSELNILLVEHKVLGKLTLKTKKTKNYVLMKYSCDLLCTFNAILS
jgi:hypothetical protein